MALPDPVPGLVIRYSYLWGREAREGREEGGKDRPCAIVVAAGRAEDGRTRVMVAPITHAPPQGAGVAIEVPLQVGRALGLDDARSWIVTAEVNLFTWPGPDVRPTRGRDFAFGRLPNRLLGQVRRGVLERVRLGVGIVERDEV